jgi:structural maintenance of chromosome 3 (chondroitin sulfate proteoglycan 6)
VQQDERRAQSELYDEFGKVQDSLAAQDDALATLQAALDRLVARRDTVAAELAEVNARRSALEVEVQETEAGARASNIDAAQYRTQLKEVTAQVRRAEQELQRIEPEHHNKAQELSELEGELATVRTKVEALYGRQGRGTQFSSKAERDRFLQTQIDSLAAQVQQKTALLERTTREVTAEEARLKREHEDVEKAKHQQGVRTARLEEVSTLIRAQTQKRNELQELRKTGWRELEKLQEEVQENRQELEKAKQQLNRSLPRHIAQGLAAVKEIVERHQIRGYYGPLIENIELTHENLRTAVEVAAGNALFHVVVENDKVAARLIEELDRLKAGRLTFLPLNQLREVHVNYPEPGEAYVLKDKALRYDPKFKKAIDQVKFHLTLCVYIIAETKLCGALNSVVQVFGKKLLVRDLDAAAHFSKEYNLDAITWEGDQVSSKGGFEGGFHDDRASKIGAYLRIRECGAQLESQAQRERDMRVNSEQAEGKVNEVVRELQLLENERAHMRQNDQLTREIKNRESQLEAARAGLDMQKRGITTLQQQIQVASTQQESFRAEQASQLVDKLSAKERSELAQLEERQRVLHAQMEVAEKELMEVSTTKERLLADLDSNLRRRKDELERTLAEVSENAAGSRDFQSDLANLRINQDHYQALVATAKKELKEMGEAIAKKKEECAALEKRVEEEREASQGLQERIDDVTGRLDKLLNKRSMLRETVHTKQRMMRDLGSIAQRDKDEVRGLDEKRLEARRDKVSKELKKYSKVNRKAIEQYMNFNDRRVELVKRKEEMDRDSVAIQQLVDSLDAQKDEAILRTFRGVSHHFSEVFAELVPGGKGQLIMRTTMDAAAEQEDETQGRDDLRDRILNGDSEGQAPAISTFQGVQVRVSFTGAGQQYQMQQLSGGQKALVALALIFAIQRCDPAPFYLFDEIDQALDANYRVGVARLIQKQVNSRTASAQFITTTFRPELVAVADKCYGIGLKDKVSKIDGLEKVSPTISAGFSVCSAALLMAFLALFRLLAVCCAGLRNESDAGGGSGGSRNRRAWQARRCCSSLCPRER